MKEEPKTFDNYFETEPIESPINKDEVNEVVHKDEPRAIEDVFTKVDGSANQELEIRKSKQTVEEQFSKEDMSAVEKIIKNNVDNAEFRKQLSPIDGDLINEATFKSAIGKILDSEEITVAASYRISLFRQTLEYYLKNSEFEGDRDILWHSTSSFSLLSSLKKSLAGGYGDITGEAAASDVELIQKSLSVTNPTFPSAESFQQMYARLSAGSNLNSSLSIDSEKVTGQSLPEVFVSEFLATTPSEQLQQIFGSRGESKSIEEKVSLFIKEFNNKDYSPDPEAVKLTLAEISEDRLEDTFRQRLQAEAEDPFPCMLSLKSPNNEKGLISGQSHIPFELHYYGEFVAEDIEEIRVPDSKINKVKQWLLERGVDSVKVVPIELFEIKRIIQSSIKK